MKPFELESFSPTLALNRYVQSIWTVQRNSFEAVMVKSRVIPNGSCHILVKITDVKFKEQSPEFDIAACEIKFYGAARQHVIVPLDMLPITMGVTFRPGGAFPFLGLPASAITGTGVDPELLWGDLGRHLFESVMMAKNLASLVRIVENALLKRLKSCDLRLDPIVSRAIERMLQPIEVVSVAALSDELGVSQRQLLRRYDRWVGLNPKMLTKVLRLQRAVERLRLESSGWADIAIGCGYYDQAHMINDFNELTGLNPEAFRKELSG